MAKYDLVFEGGGAKGFSFVGALEALQEAGHTHRRLVGTSAGAITATLLAAGYTPQELLAAITERLDNGRPRFSSFMDSPSREDFSEDLIEHSETLAVLRGIHIPGLPNFEGLDRMILNGLLNTRLYGHLFAFVECGGLFSGSKFLEWLHEKLAHKGIGEGTTLKEFADQTNSDVSLVVSDTTDKEMLILNHRTVPKCPVAWAVRMSMSLPFVWCEVVWQEEWGTYLERSKTGNKIVDGGVLSNFPIRLIDVEPGTDRFVQEVMGDTVAAEAGTLGLLIDEELPVEGAENTPRPPKLVNQLRVVQRVARLVDTMTRARDNEEIRSRKQDICRLPAKGYGTTEFEMDSDRLNALIETGSKAMKAHLGLRP
jgi:predicted acylesterase/phospholipase RssA